MKIVIVEDEEIFLKVLKEKFERENFSVKTAENGEEALSVIKKSRPDIIVLDVILPKKDGFTVLKELKADADLKTIPVIMLSNLGQDEEIKKALRLGAIDYFVKTQHPIKEIVEKVRALLIRPK